MPLFDLPVMKMQGWWHHISPRKDFQAKVKADVVDVDVLLGRAEEGVLSIMTSVRCADICVSLWSGRSCSCAGMCSEASPAG